MTVISHNHVGEYHIVIRLKGTPERIALFHRVMLKCDPEWPWKGNTASAYVCQRCAGLSYQSPRCSPHDIKVAAKQVGGVKVKIRNFAPLANCRGGNVSYDYQNDRIRVPINEIYKLYLAHGVVNFFDKYKGTPTTPRIVTAVTQGRPPAVEPVELPELPESILIDTVLQDQEIVIEPTPLLVGGPTPGSANQHPYGGEGDDLEGWVM